ncbi:MAG TPA: sigma-70 family RNA polymerase sigma factor [Planctomycetota bacterium]|nr:sigma-70 family RNA polymerase sigma factor [Planctomycetota bacterium]
MNAGDDVSLVARAKQGDRSAFGELVTRHERAMLAIARAYFASEADAEDAVQEAFVKAYRTLGQLANDGLFAPWLARITVNTCLDTLRARTDKVSLADFATTAQFRSRVGAAPLTPASLASQGEQAEALKAAIGRLPEEQRVALMLRYVEDMTYDQIADYLGVPSSTVRGRLHSAKQALRELLENPSRQQGA